MQHKKTVMILINGDRLLYYQRKEIIDSLLNAGYRVILSLPYGERVNELIAEGCEFIDTPLLEARKKNPFKDLTLLCEYVKIFSLIKPDIIFGFTIKPNIYGAIAAQECKIPFVATITGLGTALQNSGIMQKFLLYLYHYSLSGVQKIFFHNTQNRDFMISHCALNVNYEVLPGSGVNLQAHCYEAYPPETDELIFSMIARIMKDKGIEEFLAAAKSLKKEYPKLKFRVIGSYEEEIYREKINLLAQTGVIEYFPEQKNIHSFIAESNAIIHPSYHEGMSNVLLEAGAVGRPVLASKVHGCIETFDEGVSGIGFESKNTKDLERAIKEFINLPYQQKLEMGKLGRAKMEREFDRKFVVEKYLNEVKNVRQHL